MFFNKIQWVDGLIEPGGRRRQRKRCGREAVAVEVKSGEQESHSKVKFHCPHDLQTVIQSMSFKSILYVVMSKFKDTEAVPHIKANQHKIKPSSLPTLNTSRLAGDKDLHTLHPINVMGRNGGQYHHPRLQRMSLSLQEQARRQCFCVLWGTGQGTFYAGYKPKDMNRSERVFTYRGP